MHNFQNRQNRKAAVTVQLRIEQFLFFSSPPFCTYGGTPYICSGVSGSGDCNIYNKDTNGWEEFGALPGSVMYADGVACFPSGKMMTIGG